MPSGPPYALFHRFGFLLGSQGQTGTSRGCPSPLSGPPCPQGACWLSTQAALHISVIGEAWKTRVPGPQPPAVLSMLARGPAEHRMS